MASIKVGSEAIRVTGAKELRSALRRMEDRTMMRELAKVHKAAADLVVARARGNTDSKLEQSAASRLRAGRAAASATVTLGGRPQDLGAEFGAGQDVVRQRSSGTYLGYNQFEPWTKAGHFLYPAIRESRDEIIESYGDGIERLFGRKP